MIITKIEPQKHHKNRLSVYIDGTFAFGISEYAALRFHLKEGMILTQEALHAIRDDALRQEARDYALRLLDARAYTEKAMRQKLYDRGTDAEIIEKTIEFLHEYQYIDDVLYAQRYVQAAIRQGKSGKRKIMYDLVAKGIAKEIAEQVICENNVDETDTVTEILKKKLKDDYTFPNIMKAKRYALSRGFSTDSIDSALKSLSHGEEWTDA